MIYIKAFVVGLVFAVVLPLVTLVILSFLPLGRESDIGYDPVSLFKRPVGWLVLVTFLALGFIWQLVRAGKK